MIINVVDYLAHFGTPRHSGRYPWGSGDSETGSQRNKSFLGYVEDLRKSGMSETDIASNLKMSTTELRAKKSIAKTAEKQANICMAQRLKDKNYSNVAIGQRMGINESSVRALLVPGQMDKLDVLQTTSKMLREQVDKKGFIDIGSGVENHLGISSTKLNTAAAMLKEQGYEIHSVQVDQLGTNNKTLIKVLAPPGTTYRDVAANKDQIHLISEYSNDGGRTFFGIKTPQNMDSKRIGINYADHGGADADGVIYVRRGVPDVSLGASRYAQVRIAVDGTHYLKGMAMYKDDLPDGVDLVFNTNKKDTGNKLDAMKELKRTKDGHVDSDNPFGSAISRQSGVMNVVNEEGDWQKWSRNLSSQMLSKQSPRLASEQLNMTYERRKNELNEILHLTNPAVKKKLLDSYADGVDSAAVHLKAAALPRQASHVILPINSMKEHEVYAPNYEDGERVVLIRYPHGGIFEIPELTVNNRHPEAKQTIGRANDAVGIHTNVAKRLSGADFDGDTVLVIPNGTGKIKTSPALQGLKGFDPSHSYPGYPGMKKMDARTKGFEMGDVSNLITDMTIKGATQDEIARAVRHSMVVIDAEKHGLNWKQSAIDNGIKQLKTKYQGKSNAGAHTLVSRATSRIDVPRRKQGFKVDPVTGEKVYRLTGESYVNAKGKTIIKSQRSTKLAETTNAHTLSSGTVIEKLYADHSNRLKDLANQARLTSLRTPSSPWSDSAKKVYAKEVTTLDSKLNLALRNRPLERQAQILANSWIAAKRQDNPEMDAAELKKLKGQALTEARNRTGAKKQQIVLTDSEWAAIQAGAISNNKLKNILDNADLDRVKELATPRIDTLMTITKTLRAKSMLLSGYTQAEVAAALGVSVSTLKKSVQ